MPARMIVEFVLFVAYLALCLFLPAGTLAYAGAWVLLVLMTGGGLLITGWLYRHDPGLLRERLASPVQRGQETWDRVFLMALMIGFTAWLAFAAGTRPATGSLPCLGGCRRWES